MYTRPLGFFLLTLIVLANTQSTCPDGSNPAACLVDPCLTAKCPAYPLATCVADYCSGGCKAVFMIGGNAVACNSTTGACPKGNQPTACLVDPCSTAKCPTHPLATCVADYCSGGCDAVFVVSGQVVDCSKPGVCPDGSQPNACLIDPCTTAKCPSHLNATCVASYCGSGCDAVFIEKGRVILDCNPKNPDSCLGNCVTDNVPTCSDPSQTRILSYCTASSISGCEWKAECSGTCCVSSFGNCTEESRYNNDWCPEGSTCCLSSDAIGVNTRSYTCCPSGSICVPPPFLTMSPGMCVPKDNPCLGITCPSNQQCTVEKGRPVCSAAPISPCALVACTPNAVCKVDSDGKPVCVPVDITAESCAAVLCPYGYDCVSGPNGASCVPSSGKPGECPTVSSTSVGICISECASDLMCNGTKKCCRNACGGTVCSEPVSGTVKPGTCPNIPARNVDVCVDTCMIDSDCDGVKKCCGPTCNKQCVRPVENPCDFCPINFLSAQFAAPKLCPDGKTSGWECNKATCSWEYKDCSCSCNLTAYAVDIAASSSLGIGSPVSICLEAVAAFSAETKEAAASTSTTSDAAIAADYLSRCYGSGTCEYIGGKCVPSWGCSSCLPVPPKPKCERYGCQREKCVAPGSPITLECAAPSHNLSCLDKAICDVDPVTGVCGWQQTEDYKKCVANPDQETQTCSTRDPCKCSADPNCFWCLSRYRTLDASTISVGRCLSNSLVKKCLAPVSLDGLGGSVLDSATDCKPASGSFENLIESKDLVSVEQKLGEYVSQKSELAGLTIHFNSILTPEKLANSYDGGIARSLIDITGPKPTDPQLSTICKIITDTLLSSDTSRPSSSIASFIGESCRLIEVKNGYSSGGSLKRQASDSGSTTYLHEASATLSSNGSNMPRDFVVSLVLSVIALYFAW